MKKASPRPGEYVTLQDITTYALPAHVQCGGRGYRGATKTDESLCDCARTRFLDANIFRVWADDDVDALRWGPNPPTADELKEAAKRSFEGWVQFQKDVQPDKVKE